MENYKPDKIEIFAAANDNYMPHLTVVAASILKNATEDDFHCFYIPDGGISDKHKNRFLKLKKIKNFDAEFIKIDDKLFKEINLSKDCKHEMRQLYFDYLKLTEYKNNYYKFKLKKLIKSLNLPSFPKRMKG